MNILCVFELICLIIDCLILVLSYMNILKYVLKVHEYFICVLSWFAYLLNLRMLIICMNVIVCVIYDINVGIYFLCWLLVLRQLMRREALATWALAVGFQRPKQRNICINIIWICICIAWHVLLSCIYVILLCMSVWEALESLCCAVMKCTDFK
jgi:hypothetical protein